jgi:hypothetical protein
MIFCLWLLLFALTTKVSCWNVKNDSTIQRVCDSLSSLSNDGTALAGELRLLNETIHSLWETKIAITPAEPSMRICLLTRMTSLIYQYSFHSYFIWYIYSQIHHFTYLLFPLFPDSSTADYQYHRKLVPVLEALYSDEYRCDYVIWFDAGSLDSNFFPIYYFLLC